MTYSQGGAADSGRPSDGEPPAPQHSGGGHGSARRVVLAVVAALAVGLTGGVLIGRTTAPAEVVTAAPVAAPTSTATLPGANTPQPGVTTSSPSPPAPPTSVALLPPLPAADEELAAPISVAIPRLGIDQSVVELGVTPERKLEVPANGTDIGWWRSGPVPGEPGNAVIAGHVNWNGGRPAVFSELASLAPGDEVFVNRGDGTTATYQVTRTARYPKNDFPNAEIYRLDGDPELTLITCGGDFVGSHYLDNIVVFADLVADTRLAPSA